MQELMNLPIEGLPSDESDIEALELFKNLGAELDLEQQEAHSELEYQNAQEDEQAPKLSRLSKLKKESKKDKKKKKQNQKHRQKKKHRLNRDNNSNVSPGPRKKVKREGSTKKKAHDDDRFDNDDRGSSEFDSVSDSQEDLRNELNNLNPDLAEDNEESPKKRLIKSGRKQKIQDKEGFKLQQLGVGAEVNYSDDDSFSGEVRRKKRAKKEKVKVPTNEQIMNAFKDHGVVESEGQEEGDRNYDRGLDMLNSLKSKSKNSIRVNNRLFGDLEMDLQKQEEQVNHPENLELELGPKISSSSHRNSFLSKAENIKKQRGLEADINHEEFERKAQEKAKQSIARIVSSMVSQDYHDDIDLEIKAPNIARGRSAELINNTVFLRQTLDKATNQVQQKATFTLKQTKSLTYSSAANNAKKDCLSRQQLFKDIQDQTRMRRSKYISNDELKNSFKKTNLEELQEARKKIIEKRRKQAYSDDDGDGDSQSDFKADSEMNQMIEKEEKVCGDIEQQDSDNQQNAGKEQNNEDKDQEENEDELLKSIQEGDENNEDQNEQLNEYRNMVEDEASQSNHEDEEHPQAHEDDDKFVNDINGEPRPSEPEENSQLYPPQQQQQPQAVPEQIIFDAEKERQMHQLEEEGIIVRKRRRQQQVPEKQLKEVNLDQYLLDAPDQDNNLVDGKAESVNEEVAAMKNIEQAEGNNEEFTHFRKLRKIAQVIARKKQEREAGRQYASQFIQNEAEQGSDNQEHDDIIKNINYDAENKEYEGLDLDADLVQLIDNAVDLNQENEFEAFRKYLEDVRMKDKQQIRKIVRGEFWKKHEDLQLQIEEDEKQRQQRMEQVMEWMKQREEEEGQGIYLKSEHENYSEEDQEFGGHKKKKKEEEEECLESEQDIPEQQEMAKLSRFLEETLPSSAKKQFKPMEKELSFQPLPESFKMEKRSSSVQKTISMSKFGSRIGSDLTPLQMLSRKNTSSLVNQILSKSNKVQKKLVHHHVFKKNGKK